MDRFQSRGLYFEELTPGQEIHSPARTVTEADVVQFAGMAGDYTQLHTDAEFAKNTPYGQRIAHGLLGLCVASGLAARTGIMEGTVLAFLGLTWKFKAPLLMGDTIRLEIKVQKTRAMPSMGGGMAVLSMAILNQRDEVVQQGEWNLLIRGRQEGTGSS
jgi:3-hydroxybutyryl-CoA dehydratase